MTSERTARRSPRLLPVAALALLALCGCKAKAELEAKRADEAIEAAVEDPWLDAIGSEDGGEVAPPSNPAPTPDAVAPPNPSPSPSPEPTAEPSEPPGHDARGSDRRSPAPADASATPSPAEPLPAEPSLEPDAEPSPEPTADEPEPEPEPASPPPITLADFDGSYHYVGGSGQRQQLDQAIEDMAQKLPAIIRGIGRKRLTKTNQLDKSLKISIDGDKVITTYASGFNPSATIGGGQITWTSKKGDKYRVKVQQKGSKLIQVAVSEDGSKTTVFVLSSDRSRLTVHHKINADRLPEPMTYRLSYARD